MESREVSEHIEHAEHAGQKKIGLAMAVTAVLLAIVTMLGHRTHSEELVLQNQATDQWGYYQAKNNRGRMHADHAKLAALAGGEKGAKLAEELSAESERQRKGGEEEQKKARELEADRDAASRRSDFYDVAEVLLEVSIVLCSISLLAGGPLFFRLSFISTAIGVGLAASITPGVPISKMNFTDRGDAASADRRRCRSCCRRSCCRQSGGAVTAACLPCRQSCGGSRWPPAAPLRRQIPRW